MKKAATVSTALRLAFTAATCVLWLTALPQRGLAAGPAPVGFDSPGSAITALLTTIKEASFLADHAVPPAGPGRPVKPVVLAVSGITAEEISILGIELKDILRIWKELFPGKPPPDEERLRQRIAELKSIRKRADASVKRAQNYVEQDLRESARRNHLDLDIINFPWSRDPKDTETAVNDLKRELLALRDSPSTRGQPLYIVAHSWGSILVHEALIRLEKEGQVVEVQRLVTLGSPLVPHKIWLWAFKEINNVEEHLQRRIVKPRGVRRWVNLWAELDPYSNSITAADENVRVDWGAAPYMTLLRALCKSPEEKTVQQDLDVLSNSIRWHFAYLNGFQAALQTLHQTVFWDIPQKDIALILPVP